VVIGGVRWLLVMLGGYWWHWMVIGGVRWLLVVLDGYWWC